MEKKTKFVDENSDIDDDDEKNELKIADSIDSEEDEKEDTSKSSLDLKVKDPWMQIRFVQDLSNPNEECEFWIVRIPFEGYTLCNIIEMVIQKSSDLAIRQSVLFCGAQVISDDKSGRTPYRIKLRITLVKNSSLNIKQVIEKAIEIARTQVIDYYHDWKLIQTKKSKHFFNFTESKSKMELSFDCKCFLPIANGLRRSMIADCPTVAIDKMVVHKNTSLYLSNFLGLHFAMMPLIANSIDSVYNILEQSQCECDKENLGCEKCSIRLSLSVKHNVIENKNRPFVITSRDFKINDKDQNRGISLIDKPMFFVKLDYGQEFQADFVATRGTLSTHGKYGPACPAVCYPKLARVEIQQSKLSMTQKQELVSTFPKLFALQKEQLETLDIEKWNDIEKDMCTELVASWNIPNAIKLVHHEDIFEFYVKSTGALPARDIVKGGLKSLVSRCDFILKLLDDPVWLIKKKIL